MDSDKAIQTNKKVERVTLPIFGMTCWGGGTLPLERALMRVHGVRYVYVNAATEMAYVEYDPASCDAGRLEAAIKTAGFQAGVPSYR